MFHAGAGAKELKRRQKKEMRKEKKEIEKKIGRKITEDEYLDIINKEMRKEYII